MMNSNDEIKGACCVIQNSAGKYLLQMRDDNEGIFNPLKWSFFGGATEGHDPELTMIIELDEELDIHIYRDDITFLYTDVVNGSLASFFKLNRTIEWLSFNLHEGAGAGFFTVDEALKIDCAEHTRKYFQKLKEENSDT